MSRPLDSPTQQLEEERRMREDEEQEEFEDDGGNDGAADDNQPHSSSASANASGRSSPQPVDNSQVYAAFGRDTAAGRALFKLYNKNKTSYTPAVRVTTRPTDPIAEAAAAKRAQAERLKKRVYQPPKLKKAEKEPEVGRVPQWGGKKTTDTIDRERERDAPLYKAPTVPLAKLQHRDNEKAKLQNAHQAKPTRNAPLPGRRKDGDSAGPLRAPKDPNQALMDRIIDEIDERHQFLDKMRELGDLSHEPAVKAEIAHRLRDLKKLEKIMQEQDEEVIAAASAGMAAASLR
jgi:hypothetical protein